MKLTKEIIDSIYKDETTGKWIVDEAFDGFGFFDQMITWLNETRNFSFARYGDGEFNAVFQDSRQPANCDGHQYFPDMGARLKEILESNPEYYMGLQPLATQQRGMAIQELNEDIEWVNSDVIHNASIEGRLKELVEAMSNRRVIMVGPEHLSKLGFVDEFYTVARDNCWRFYPTDLSAVKGMLKENDILLLCCSMPAEIMIDDLYKYRKDITVIDSGSVFDIYVGVKSRSYHHKLEI